MLKYFAVAAIFSLFATSSGAALVEGDPEAGKTKSVSCQSCHGADGNSLNPMWPKLAGQNASYIKKQLQDFKSGLRSNPIMSPMAAKLSDEDIKDLAVYYASQQTSKGATPEEYLALGEKVYRQGNKKTGVPACMACHGPAGDGNPAAAWPKLAGQHGVYVETQLKAYRSGERANDPNAMMEGVTKRMSDEEITAVANYVTGLHIAH